MFLQGGGSPQLYYHDCSGRITGHTTRAPPVGFELETNGFQFYAIGNLDNTSRYSPKRRFIQPAAREGVCLVPGTVQFPSTTARPTAFPVGGSSVRVQNHFKISKYAFFLAIAVLFFRIREGKLESCGGLS